MIMTTTEHSFNFNEQYMNINNKLKKKFMRKPNISEAANEFIALAIQCEHLELPSYAGQAYEGAAKCESLMGNTFSEADYHLSAARQFITAENKLKSLKFHSPERENLEAGLGSYLHALQLYPHNSLIRTSIFLEMAECLISLNKNNEAAVYYEQALNTMQENTMKGYHMKNLLNLYVDCGKYEAALEMGNLICDKEINTSEDIIAEIQVSRILLTLLVNPPEDKKPKSLKKLLCDMLNDNETSFPINIDLKLKLQSLIVCFERKDTNNLIKLSAEMKPYLTSTQNDLLILLRKELK